ncbi:MAG: hypothetical protein A4E24_00393 [Methanomethylovorans sp. PtaU1.Bin093]|nr:MAG: hypothetical protein A4E24_00393 [Methanomethylovorans sp. PtaU1.Bin093]
MNAGDTIQKGIHNKHNMYSSILTAVLLLIVLLVSMAGAEELKIEGLSDTYSKGDIITFTLVADEGLTSESMEEWNISLKMDGATKIDFLFDGKEDHDGLSAITVREKPPYHYGYGSGNADIFTDIEKKEMIVSIDSSMMNRGDHIATFYMHKEGTSETHEISANIKIT